LIDQKYELAGRIARAAAVFCVDEVIVFDDAPDTIPPKLRQGNRKFKSKAEALAAVEDHKEPWENPDQFLFHNLEFLECPAHLRTYFFPQHPNLKGSGKLPPLDMPHHMRAGDWCQYREGVSLGSDEEGVTMVDCGLPHPVTIRNPIPEGARVTVKFSDSNPPRNWPNLTPDDISKLKVEPTSAEEPREEAGYYWGYSTRKAHSISAVFQEHPFEQDDGYDFSIGTSERGVPLSSIIPDPGSKSPVEWSNQERPEKLPPKFKHLLVVFGGVAGLEPAVASDPVLKEKGLTKETAHDVFDWWVNLVPGQGSRTIRTEEAVLLGLMGLRPYVDSML
jgi:predicted SPOUT superfamily RNA methylase MTH1